MKDEYIVVNKIKLLERITELRKINSSMYENSINSNLANELVESVVNNSIPLEPIVSNACNAGGNICCSNSFYNDSEERYEVNEIAINEEISDYINNLKLDI